MKKYNGPSSSQLSLPVKIRAGNGSREVFTITEKAPTWAFSWLKAPTSASTFKTLLRYRKQEPKNGK